MRFFALLTLASCITFDTVTTSVAPTIQGVAQSRGCDDPNNLISTACDTAVDGEDDDLCTLGQIECLDGRNLGCLDLPDSIAEVCNGLDDDCNGKVDEGFAVGASCTLPMSMAGACGAAHIQCSADGQSACTLDPHNGVETCNGLDDDCNGMVDDGFNLGAMCTADADGTDFDFCTPGTVTCGGCVDDAAAIFEDLATPDDEDCSGDAFPVDVTLEPIAANVSDIIWNGEAYGVVWAQLSEPVATRSGFFGAYDGTLFFSLLDPGGYYIGAPTQLSVEGPLDRNPAIAWDGKNFGVVWQHCYTLETTNQKCNANNEFTGVQFRRVGSDGVLLGSTLNVTSQYNNFDSFHASVQPIPTLSDRWLVTYASAHSGTVAPAADSVLYMRMAMVVQDQSATELQVNDATVTFGIARPLTFGDEAIVVYQEKGATNYKLAATRFKLDFSGGYHFGETTYLTDGTTNDVNAKVVADASGFGVTWIRGSAAFFRAWDTHPGSAPTPRFAAVSVSAAAHTAVLPTVTVSGDSFMIAWEDSSAFAWGTLVSRTTGTITGNALQLNETTGGSSWVVRLVTGFQGAFALLWNESPDADRALHFTQFVFTPN